LAIADFLFEKAELEEVLMDLTPLIEGGEDNGKSTGDLWVGFCNAKKEEIFKLEGLSSRLNVFRRFILLRELISYQYEADYIIIDTSPGIRQTVVLVIVHSSAAASFCCSSTSSLIVGSFLLSVSVRRFSSDRRLISSISMRYLNATIMKRRCLPLIKVCVSYWTAEGLQAAVQST
jgi:hypothetical protein